MDIKNLRERRGLTQQQLATQIDVSLTTICSWENNKSKPLKKHLKALEEIFLSSLISNVQEELPFRAIQYLGSKQKLANTIVNVINDLDYSDSRVADLFAGTGVVSSSLSKNRPVTAVDVQNYSRILNSALLLGSKSNLSLLSSDEFLSIYNEVYQKVSILLTSLLNYERIALEEAKTGNTEKIVDIIECGSIRAFQQKASLNCSFELRSILKKTLDDLKKIPFDDSCLTTTLYFGGAYFTYKQAIQIDCLYITLKKLEISDDSIAQSCILSTASEVVNTVGKQFAQPIKLVKPSGDVSPLLLKRTLKDRNMSIYEVFQKWVNNWQAQVINSSFDHKVVVSDVIDFLKSDNECGLFYADPPYTIDHYSRFYHVLETISLRDNPTLDEMNKRGSRVVMRGLYRKDRFQSKFCIPSQAHNAFEELIQNVALKSAPLLLSYSPFDSSTNERSRLLTIEQLTVIGQKYYSEIEIMEIDNHSHRKLNSNTVNNTIRADAERLFIFKGSKL